MILQVLLIAVALFIMIAGLMNRNTHSGKAWKKILLILMTAFMIVAVIFPDTVTRLANAVGVGRGADLLLYVLVVAFIFYVINGYLKQQDQRTSLYRLARQVAISDAHNRLKKK